MTSVDLPPPVVHWALARHGPGRAASSRRTSPPSPVAPCPVGSNGPRFPPAQRVMRICC